MKVLIFGTGSYSLKYRTLIPKEYICGFLDNDINNIGRTIDGHKVCSPIDVDYDAIDRVFILIKNYDEICKQLVLLGVNKDKIYTYKDVIPAFGLKDIVIHDGQQEFTWDQNTTNNTTSRVLLISHELSRTGVPVATMNIAEVFVKMGYYTLIGSLRGGTLSQDLDDKGLPYVDDLEFVKTDDSFRRFINSFDLIMVCTMAAAGFISLVPFYNKVLVMWVNEKYKSVFDHNQLPPHRDNMLYFADGEHAAQVFKEYYPDRDIGQLYYCLPEDIISIENKKSKDRLRFTFIGLLSVRKAPDLIIEALKQLTEDERGKISVLFVGAPTKELDMNWDEIKQMFPEVSHIKEVSQMELLNVFAETDVLICPSREDTVPIVVTQAFQNSVPCIVSDEVGQAAMMDNGQGGIVFHSGNINELSKAIEYCLCNQEEIIKRGKQGRAIFDRSFSEEYMRSFLKENIISKVDELRK